MPDGTSRFTLAKDGSTVYHFMGCSTFAEYTLPRHLLDTSKTPPRHFMGCSTFAEYTS